MGATDGASFPGQQSGPTQPVQVSKKTRVSPFIPPPPPPSPRLGERVLSCGFFPADMRLGSSWALPTMLNSVPCLLFIFFGVRRFLRIYMLVFFLGIMDPPGVGCGGSHKFSLVGGFDTYSSSSSSEFLHMMELVPLGGLWCCGRSVGRSALGSGGVAQAVL